MRKRTSPHLVISRHGIAASRRGVGDFASMVSETFNMQNRAVADRPDLHSPEILIEQVEAIGDSDASPRHVFRRALVVRGLGPIPGVRRQRPVGTVTSRFGVQPLRLPIATSSVRAYRAPAHHRQRLFIVEGLYQVPCFEHRSVRHALLTIH